MNLTHNKPLKTPTVAVIIALTFLAGCQSLNNKVFNDTTLPTSLAEQLPQTHLLDSIPREKLNTATRQLTAEGIKALDAKDYRKASDIFNLAVKTEMTNSYLHFLNAVAYQFRAITGESGLFPLAEQGYQLAIKFDNSNWLARYYGGLLAMNQRNYAMAQSKLAEAALYAPKQPELLYDLAVASYYNHDPKTAAGALAGLRELQGNTIDPRVYRASAIVAASLDQPDLAQKFLDQFRSANTSKEDIAMAMERVTSWQETYDRVRSIKTGAAGYDPYADPYQQSGGIPGDFGGQVVSEMPGASGFGAPESFAETQMVVVDVIILSTEEDNTNAMGVNLLDGLKLQFGNPDTLTPAFTRSFNNTVNNNNPNPLTSFVNSRSTTITHLITMPAVSYNLNIANSNAKNNEVLARPTLVALGNQTSNFFSGVDVNAAAVSNGQGSAVQIQKEVGVKLAVTPEFLPNNLIKLNIAAERTFLTNPSKSVVFDFRLDTTKTTVNANVVMKFGETLILSGLSERDDSADRDGVPFLQDIPVVQYLFSRNVEREYYKSVLILLTPRKAQYTNRSELDIAIEQADLSPEQLAIEEFEAKYKPWFKPIPNIAEISNRLNHSSLYREFQTGDLDGTWQSNTNHQERLKTALRYLFY